jgi:hypothetical protein
MEVTQPGFTARRYARFGPGYPSGGWRKRDRVQPRRIPAREPASRARSASGNTGAGMDPDRERSTAGRAPELVPAGGLAQCCGAGGEKLPLPA